MDVPSCHWHCLCVNMVVGVLVKFPTGCTFCSNFTENSTHGDSCVARTSCAWNFCVVISRLKSSMKTDWCLNLSILCLLELNPFADM